MEKKTANDYELQRQANIKERDALLKKLSLQNATVAFVPKSAPKKPAASTTKKKAPSKKPKKEEGPRRTSSRLAGLDVDNQGLKRRAIEEYESRINETPAKRRRITDELDLKDIKVSGMDWDGRIVDFVNRGAQPNVRTFGTTEVMATTDKELRALREKMSGLHLYNGFEPNSKNGEECPLNCNS